MPDIPVKANLTLAARPFDELIHSGFLRRSNCDRVIEINVHVIRSADGGDSLPEPASS